MVGDIVRHACYCGSRNLYADMATATKALLRNSDVGRVWWLTEDADVGFELPPEVTVIDVSGQEFFRPDGPNMGSRYTYLAMMRAALCHVLPADVHMVLSMDCDTLAIRDVSEAWDTPMDGCYFAAAVERHRCYEGLLYTNTGVALYDLDMLRGGKADEVIDCLNRRRYTWVEQDAMNYLCQGRIAEMDGNYNACDWTEHPDPRLLHFAGHADWRERPELWAYRDMTWDEARRGR